MKLKLNIPINSLEGKPLGEETTIAKVLANSLMASASIPGISAVKAYDLALSLFKTGEAELDRADTDALIKFVENHPQQTYLAKGQIINVLSAALIPANTK